MKSETNYPWGVFWSVVHWKMLKDIGLIDSDGNGMGHVGPPSREPRMNFSLVYLNEYLCCTMKLHPKKKIEETFRNCITWDARVANCWLEKALPENFRISHRETLMPAGNRSTIAKWAELFCCCCVQLGRLLLVTTEAMRRPPLQVLCWK